MLALRGASARSIGSSFATPTAQGPHQSQDCEAVAKRVKFRAASSWPWTLVHGHLDDAKPLSNRLDRQFGFDLEPSTLYLHARHDVACECPVPDSTSLNLIPNQNLARNTKN